MSRLSGPAIVFWAVLVVALLYYASRPVSFGLAEVLSALVVAGIVYLIAKGISRAMGPFRPPEPPPAA